VLELREASSGPVVRSVDPIRRLGEIRVPEVPEVGSDASVADPVVFGVEVAGISEDPSEGALVYEPGHPDADALGYVRYPNVDLVRETIDLMEARRAYEANATVFDAMKAMLMRAIRI
jgi:flagellar basal-body rod protein FlgC